MRNKYFYLIGLNILVMVSNALSVVNGSSGTGEFQAHYKITDSAGSATGGTVVLLCPGVGMTAQRTALSSSSYISLGGANQPIYRVLQTQNLSSSSVPGGSDGIRLFTFDQQSINNRGTLPNIQYLPIEEDRYGYSGGTVRGGGYGPSTTAGAGVGTHRTGLVLFDSWQSGDWTFKVKKSTSNQMFYGQDIGSGAFAYRTPLKWAGVASTSNGQEGYYLSVHKQAPAIKSFMQSNCPGNNTLKVSTFPAACVAPALITSQSRNANQTPKISCNPSATCQNNTYPASFTETLNLANLPPNLPNCSSYEFEGWYMKNAQGAYERQWRTPSPYQFQILSRATDVRVQYVPSNSRRLTLYLTGLPMTVTGVPNPVRGTDSCTNYGGDPMLNSCQFRIPPNTQPFQLTASVLPDNGVAEYKFGGTCLNPQTQYRPTVQVPALQADCQIAVQAIPVRRLILRVIGSGKITGQATNPSGYQQNILCEGTGEAPRTCNYDVAAGATVNLITERSSNHWLFKGWSSVMGTMTVPTLCSMNQMENCSFSMPDHNPPALTSNFVERSGFVVVKRPVAEGGTFNIDSAGFCEERYGRHHHASEPIIARVFPARGYAIRELNMYHNNNRYDTLGPADFDSRGETGFRIVAPYDPQSNPTGTVEPPSLIRLEAETFFTAVSPQ